MVGLDRQADRGTHMRERSESEEPLLGTSKI
jgi:hypothetical protein